MTGNHRSYIPALAVALLSTLFFAALADAVMHGRTNAFDAAVRDTIHGWAAPPLTAAMNLVTQMGSVNVLLPLGVFVVWGLRSAGRRRAALLFAFAAVGAELLDQALKFFFRRARPEVFFGLPQPATYSFPSGHSVASCCFYGVLAAILASPATSRKRNLLVWMAAAALTLAIGFSRVYLGVHYPTDVLGGYAVAIAWVSLIRAGLEIRAVL